MFTVLSASELTSLIIVLAVAASVSGFIAGLLGVGGGIIMVPALYYAFTVMDFDIATRMHLSLGTSLAIIIPTSIMSAKTHMKFNAVDFKLIKSFGIFIVLGVILGTVLASNLKTPPLMLFFSVFAFLVGIFFIFFREKVGANPRPISQTFKALNVCDIGLGFAPTFSRKKIKNIPTKKAKTEKNNIKGGVFKLEANTVPSITPRTIKIPKDFINLKSTALNFI